MQKRIDLHTHSFYSDGTLSPAELIELAKERDISVIALTDHDTINGLDEALTHGRKLGVEVITGIEISAMHDNTNMHLLGYGFNQNAQALTGLVATIQLARHERNIKIIEKLNDLGLQISYEELSRDKGKQIGRPHIAQLLVQKGYVKNIETAFKHLLRDGGPAYEEGYKVAAKDAITTIQKAGGCVVLAHPAKINIAKTSLTNLISKLASFGLDGIEVYYPSHSKKDIKILEKIAAQLNLFLTGGSDFHGITEHGETLGGVNAVSRMPHAIWHEIEKKLNEKPDR